jgi:signal transduction histidine kinase
MSGFEFAFGLDLGANPNATDPQALAAAVRLTRDSGQLITSGIPLRIKTAAGEYIGLAMRLAVYSEGLPVDTIEQRRAAFLGSVGAGFNVQNLMKGTLDGETAQYMRFAVYDAGSAVENPASSASADRRLLFDSAQLGPASPAPLAPDADSSFTSVLPMEIGGRNWEVHFSAPKDAIIGRLDALLPWLILAGGLLSSVLLCGILYSLTSSHSRAVKIAAEITRDLRESEKALQTSAEQLQAMSRRLVEVQESERRELARELHDRVGQDLTALSISLDILTTQLSGSGGAAVAKRLEDAATLLESTSGTIENVMSELRPPMLDDYGLLPALQWYAAQFSGRTGIEIQVHGEEGMERLPQATEIALFRIVQEALTNVAKHAQATRVEIGLEHAGKRFTLSISDNGVGLESGAQPMAGRRQGLGMVTMRERTQSAGGRFEIGGTDGGGTRVVVRIPS